MAKILLVDDESDVELLANQKFRKEISENVFELLFAHNGREALNTLQEHPDIAVVVSDVNMPEMDGLALLKILKETHPSIRSIVVSAYGDTKTLRTAMNYGAYDFVTKPIDFHELGRVIHHAISEYTPPSSPLYQYQLLLADTFPDRLEINTSHEEKSCLWDGFLVGQSQMLILGISLAPTMIPSSLSVGMAHATLKAALQENPKLSLEDCEKKLTSVHLQLKAHLLVGHYQTQNHIFTFIAKGNFKVHHLTSEELTSLSPTQTTLLDVGDGVSFEAAPSDARLSLFRTH